jgi:uncharacterized FlaG/YvyC family protein
MENEAIASVVSLGNTRSSGGEISITRIRDVDIAPTEEQINVKQRLSEVKSATAKQMQVSREAFDRVVSDLKAYVQNSQRNLDFHVDDRTGRVVVQVVDATNDAVIRQIPSEEMLALAQRMQDFMEQNQQDMKGMLLELKA